MSTIKIKKQKRCENCQEMNEYVFVLEDVLLEEDTAAESLARDKNVLTKNGYKIVASDDGRQAGITCLDCLMTSWHYKDVQEKYCGNCHKFHKFK